jgi:hypothetical protein
MPGLYSPLKSPVSQKNAKKPTTYPAKITTYKIMIYFQVKRAIFVAE